MKKFFFFIILLMILIILYVFVLPSKKEIKIYIKEGQNANQIVNDLKEKNIIWNKTLFKILLKLTNASKKIMPGEYILKIHSTNEEVLWKITHSTYINDIKIVIPEGWRVEQIAERLKSKEVISDKNEFLKIVKEEKLEGKLFPSTYFFKKNLNNIEVINTFLSEYKKNTNNLFNNLKNLDENTILIIASIVEREAVIDTERPLIAAVYLNRIKNKMPLEADPTVQYALGYWKKNLSLKDLKFPSPYNTYYVKTLPPGPICNPGLNSIKAVVEPANIDALYFVADRKGRHIFNNSFKEHLKAKSRVENSNK